MYFSWFLVLLFISENESVSLLLSTTNEIILIEENDSSSVLIANATNVVAVDYHLSRNEIYYTKFTGGLFRRPLKTNSTEENPTIIAEVTESDGIAVDWVHNNIYWTDAGRKTLEVSTLDGLHRHVLFNKTHGLEKPRAIVVDPDKGLLFWSDWGDEAKVESSGLDGKHKKNIISSKDINYPNGLSLDLSNLKLYILDGQRETISSCNYNGSDFKVLKKSTSFFEGFGLTYYSNSLYWDSWRERALLEMNIKNLRQTTLRNYTQTLMLQSLLKERFKGIKAVHSSLQPKPPRQDPCNTSGCSHHCLLSPSIHSGRHLTTSCFCPFGFKLSKDRKTCTEEGYLLVSWRQQIKRHTINGESDELLTSSTTVTIALSYHLQKNLAFWSDISEHKIYRAPLDQLHNKTAIATLKTCNGLAVDWIHDVIYWTDDYHNTLEVAQLDGSKHMIIFDTGLDQPRDIALDPFAGLMFWTDWGDGEIEQSTLDGLERKVVISSKTNNRIWPNGLTIDIPAKRIYYVDGNLSCIYSSSYDGSDTNIFRPLKKATAKLFGITNLNDKLFWTEWLTRGLYMSLKDNHNTRRLVNTSNIYLSPNGIQAVHSSLQETKENPCAKANCQSICLGTKDHTAHCMGEENPVTEANLRPELIITAYKNSIIISLSRDIAPAHVLITVNCLGRVFCKNDIRCSNKRELSYEFHNKSAFYIPNLLPESHYTVNFNSSDIEEYFNVTTEPTDMPSAAWLNRNKLCNGKEDCPDGRNEDLKQCTAIENVIVYNKSKSDVFFRVDVTNVTKKQLETFVVNFSITGNSSDGKEEVMIPESCFLWPESYCFHISTLHSNTNYEFKIAAAQKGEKIGEEFIVSTVTKVEVSGPPENIELLDYNATSLLYQWHHPKQSNGKINTFIINVEETETFDKKLCCRGFFIMEEPAPKEELHYKTEITDLNPASSYAISISAKNMYMGIPVALTANTPPPPMKVIIRPNVEVASLQPVRWEEPKEVPETSNKYYSLIRYYYLLLLPIDYKPHNLNISVKYIPFEISAMLQSKFGKNFIVVHRHVKDKAASQSPIKVGRSLPPKAPKQHKLAWVQVSQYKDSFSMDCLESKVFLANEQIATA